MSTNKHTDSLKLSLHDYDKAVEHVKFTLECLKLAAENYCKENNPALVPFIPKWEEKNFVDLIRRTVVHLEK